MGKIPGTFLAMPDDNEPGASFAPGEPIGYRKNGTPIFGIAGGAPTPADVTPWIPLEFDSNVITRIGMDSAIVQVAQPVPMTTKTKRIPRSSGMTVGTGSDYSAVDDDSDVDFITLTARKIIARFTLDEDDMADADAWVNALETKGEEFAISYSDFLDNATLAVTAAETGTTVPFTSLYKALRTANTATGYLVDANYMASDLEGDGAAPIVGSTDAYAVLSALFGKVETGKYWSATDSVVIADTSFRESLRNVRDTQGNPILMTGNADVPDTLFNRPIVWSRGARTSAAATQEPTGNPLLFYGNRRYLKLGNRSNVESMTTAARAQDDVDETSVKFRVRKGFGVAHEKAWAVLEKIPHVDAP